MVWTRTWKAAVGGFLNTLYALIDLICLPTMHVRKCHQVASRTLLLNALLSPEWLSALTWTFCFLFKLDYTPYLDIIVHSSDAVTNQYILCCHLQYSFSPNFINLKSNLYSSYFFECPCTPYRRCTSASQQLPWCLLESIFQCWMASLSFNKNNFPWQPEQALSQLGEVCPPQSPLKGF